MEMNKGILYIMGRTCRAAVCMLLFLFLDYTPAFTQPKETKIYTIKNGNMYIQLSKNLRESALDSFITQFSLQELSLKLLVHTGFTDSLHKNGWKVVVNDALDVIISKPLGSVNDLLDIAHKNYPAKVPSTFDALFPAVSTNVTLGYNLIRNRNPFRVKDSVVTFFLRDYQKAGKVVLAGSFSNWDPGKLTMTKTDSGWITSVKIGPGKYWYKFVIDGNWMTDPDNRINENDGMGNINSVYYKTNKVFRLNGFANAKRVILAGSFNNWNEQELQMTRNGDSWWTEVYLANGTYTYRFIVDKNWFADPGNKERLPNEFNDYNSVIRIGKPYIFKLNGYLDAKRVLLTGSFNKWRKDELFMTRTANGWEFPYTLGPGNYEYRFIVDGTEIKDPAAVNNSPDKRANSCLIFEPNYTFLLKNFANAKTVYLSGDFNDWSPFSYAMKKDGNGWVFTVHLWPGKHLYKYIVDGKWIIDPDNKLWEDNDENTGNSVLWIAK